MKDLCCHRSKWITGNPAHNVELVDRLPKSELRRLMRNARFLVWPSQGYYETFGLVALESFSMGVPVLTSRFGVNGEIVDNGRTGLHFSPDDPGDVARTVERAWSSEAELRKMGRQARIEFETKYGADENYTALMSIYRAAISRKSTSLVAGAKSIQPARAASAG